MQKIEIESSYKSPKVVFDPFKKEFLIEGKSVLINVEEFYHPLLNWMDEFLEHVKSGPVSFKFDLEYFNLASTKRFLFFLFKLQKIQEKGIEINVSWHHANNDSYSLETGKDFEQMTGLSFDFVGYEKLHSRVSFAI